MKNAPHILDAIDSLFEQAPYFSINAVRECLSKQGVGYKPDTVKVYLSQLKSEGAVFDAGRGWYSSITESYRLDTAPIEKLVGELKEAFPLLEFACWSTAQLNDMLRHQLAKHVQFAYVERDAIGSVADWLRNHGCQTHANPGKQDIKRSFTIEENTVVVLPRTSETPHQSGFANIEKILVDVLADTPGFSIINIPEFTGGARSLMSSFRVDISVLNRYSDRRTTDISDLLQGISIN